MPDFPPMPRTKTLSETFEELLAMANPPKALLVVDGEVVAQCDSTVEAKTLVDKADENYPEWREIAIMENIPRYGGYLRSTFRAR